jgi:hypothetical protein
MKLPPLPTCDSHGWFQPVIHPAPPSWPWALPHLYGVNYAPDPGEEIIGASASPNGRSEIETGFLNDRFRFEVIGYWQGDFALVHLAHSRSRELAEKEVRNTFEAIRVKYLMLSGQVVRENQKVEITGTWPSEWAVKSLQDIGIFCSFIYEQAKGRGGQRDADAFRESITRAWPPTEQLLVYISALELAQVKLVPHLESKAKEQLAEVLSVAQSWLRQ